MSNNASSVNIRVLDKDYTVSCPEDNKASLLEAADLLNQKIKEIRDLGSIIGSERIAVMAALNLAHEFLSADKDSSNLNTVDQRISSLKDKINSALEQIELK